MIDHHAEALAKIDEALAWLPHEEGQLPYETTAMRQCLHCTRTKNITLLSVGICTDCRAWMNCETDTDPREEALTPAPTPVVTLFDPDEWDYAWPLGSWGG